MEKQEEGEYEVVITEPAEISFFEICEFLYENYSLEKAELVADSLKDYTKVYPDIRSEVHLNIV